jgi:hypothetical protein
VVLAMAFLGMQVSGQTRAVLIGRLARFEPVARRLADLPAALRSLFLVPEDGAVATALGAIAAAREAKT